MNIERKKRAIRSVLAQNGGIYFDEVALRSEEGLLIAIQQMEASGEIHGHEKEVSRAGLRKVYTLLESSSRTENPINVFRGQRG